MSPIVHDIVSPHASPFSPAEISALVLDGELAPLLDSFIPVDAFDSPELRTRVATAGRPAQLVSELDTAAWIWGARAAPPRILEFSCPVGLSARLSTMSTERAREVRFRPHDLVRIGDRWVTSPARTALDLARLRSDDTCDLALIAALVGRSGARQLLGELEEGRPLPHARRARERLTALADA